MGLTINQFTGTQTGKTLIVLGAANEFILRYGTAEIAIIYPNQEMARYSWKRHRMPGECFFWASMPMDTLVSIRTRRFFVFEDISLWPRTVYIELLDHIKRAGAHSDNVPRNLLVSF